MKNSYFLIAKKKLRLRVLFLLLLFIFFTDLPALKAECSGNWTGTQTNRRTELLAGHSATNGTMLAVVGTSNYDANHRLYVYVKSGETVFWGFHATTTQTRTGTWYYDQTTTAFFPTGTTGSNRVAFNSGSVTGTSVPTTQLDALNGPNQVTGSGYTAAYSFTNSTGADRAFWFEISGTSTFFIDWWDVTVASGSAGNYTEQTGRVYCRYWAIRNGFAPAGSLGLPNSESYHDNFTFYIAVDNTVTPDDDYLVKSINIGGSNGGGAVYFANDHGPVNTSTFDVNRRSISGTSSDLQYPLFIANPDITLWPSSPQPTASQSYELSKKTPPPGGEAIFTVVVDNPSVVDILIDLNGDGEYNGDDVLISNYYSLPGTYSIYWNGEDATNTDVPSGTNVAFETSFLFYPIHFPVFDLEQCLGITIKNVRPGNQFNELLYWDDRNLNTSDPEYQSIGINVAGLDSPEHIWYHEGNGGFANNNTVNTWTGSKVVLLSDNFDFDYDDADLEVTKRISNNKQTAGQNVTFTITAKNNGISPATGVVVNDALPSGYTIVSATPSKGTWTAPNWTIGDLDKDESETLTIVATALATGTHSNTATISGNENDPDNTNNSSSNGVINNGTVAINDINIAQRYTSVSGNVLTNDFHPDGNSLTVNTTPITAPANGNVVLNADGTYTYTPTGGFTGEDSFVYEVCDDGAPQSCDQATVTIEVLPWATSANEAPVAVNDAYVGSLNATVSGTVLANDFDSDGDALTVSSGLADTDGDGNVDNALTLGTSTTIYGTNSSGTTVSAGSLTLNSDGTFSFVPTIGFTGQIPFGYVNSDGILTDDASVTIDVLDAAASYTGNTTYALPDAVRTGVNSATTGNVLANDYDPENDNISISSTGTFLTTHGSITINSNGDYTYTPTTSYVGDDSYTYTMCDNGTPQACDNATLYITVEASPTAGNDAPIALSDSYQGAINSTITGNVTDNDSDIDGNLDYNSVTLVNGGTAAANGSLTLNSNGTFSYTPNTGYSGQVSYIYQVCDNGSPALCDQATVYIEVTGGNSTFAVDDAFMGVRVSNLTGNVLDNDHDQQGDNQTVNTTPVTSPTNGTLVLNADGSFTYTPNAGYYGSDSFVYQVCDDGTPQACDVGTVYLNVARKTTSCVISNKNVHSK